MDTNLRQDLPPGKHAVLPTSFSRRPFSESILQTKWEGDQSLGDLTKPFVIINEAFSKLLKNDASVRCLALDDEHRSFAHEAGIWLSETKEVCFTSNLFKGDKGVHVDIQMINLDTGAVRKLEIPSVRTANGGCPYDGDILFCDQGSEQYPSQLVRVNPVTLDALPLLNNYHGRRFNSLNDVIVLSPKDGTPSTVWFTDPPYAHEQSFGAKPQLPPMVYCFNPVSGEVRAVADGFDHPNGIAFSPDGSTCYVTDTSHIHGSGRLNPALQSSIYAFEVVRKEGNLPSLHNRRLFAFADCGVPDGIKCDTHGNVYCGCGDGIHVWNQYGTLLGKIVLGVADGNIGAGCANFCFVPGGKLVCFSEDRIYVVDGLAVEGDVVKKGL